MENGSVVKRRYVGFGRLVIMVMCIWLQGGIDAGSCTQWLCHLHPDEYDHGYLTDLFELSCMSGHLSMAQWLHSKIHRSKGETTPVYTTDQYEQIFHRVCEKGHLKVAINSSAICAN